MTTSEKVKLVDDLVTHYMEIDDISDKIGNLMGTRIDSPALNPFWRAFDGYVKAVAALVGDLATEGMGVAVCRGFDQHGKAPYKVP